MDFSKLADLYNELEIISSGNKIRELLSDFFKSVPKEELGILAYLTLGKISSDYEGVVLGMAEKQVLKAIITASGAESSKVKKSFQESGDVGLTAEEFCGKKVMTLIPLGKLTVKELYEKLHKISIISGSGSQDHKIGLLASMLQKSSGKEAKYVARIALGTLRMGVGEMTVLDAMAIAFTGEKKNKEILEKAYNICPDLKIIADELTSGGLEAVSKTDVRVGRPIKVMLCQRVKELKDVIDKISSDLTIEAKYDGERVQAHKDKGGNITLFSRRLDNITLQFPDLIRALETQIKAKEFVIEGEILAVDPNGKPLPFQKLMQRKRKHDIEKYAKDVPIQLKVFDLLLADNVSYIHHSYKERNNKIIEIVEVNNVITLADKIETRDVDEINKFFKQKLSEGYEGIIIKSQDSVYQAGTRGWNWIKWKKDYVEDMVDNFDLVIVGAFYGKGKRTGNYGAYLCASYNHDNDTFETVCKLGTGLTDENLSEIPEKLKKHVLKKAPPRLSVNKEMEAEVWFEPVLVVEVSAAEVTKSPIHTCASGLALRFPRFIRYRDDKEVEEATSSKEVEEIYEIGL
ncbi:ATP-dependent DNA ligase [archaeon]|jgi:DNA ligase 1|nr:ATP-dependent DNA ligase [archaeon]MBT3450918.1 ATP-dependent DNA ligase [archaeon]MBT6869564.1 ATP-dependent DNA ligase [archaeon]MBT7193444.1 ATP-dependent DNA ligase [archaeon]MBT7381035.1 ATP-dependent DNA ligase [archaeon]